MGEGITIDDGATVGPGVDVATTGVGLGEGNTLAGTLTLLTAENAPRTVLRFTVRTARTL
jgi:hypothetical protein